MSPLLHKHIAFMFAFGSVKSKVFITCLFYFVVFKVCRSLAWQNMEVFLVRQIWSESQTVTVCMTLSKIFHFLSLASLL